MVAGHVVVVYVFVIVWVDEVRVVYVLEPEVTVAVPVMHVVKVVVPVKVIVTDVGETGIV